MVPTISWAVSQGCSAYIVDGIAAKVYSLFMQLILAAAGVEPRQRGDDQIVLDTPGHVLEVTPHLHQGCKRASIGHK
jgi:hypothetical protein